MLQQVRLQVPDADLLLFTGDTAHDDLRETYMSVRTLLEDSFGAEWNEHVRIIPGNHDHRGWLRDSFSQHTNGPADPVTFVVQWLDRIGLQDALGLGAVLEHYPQVRLVVCGHVHQAFSGSLGHATVFATPAVGPQFRPRTEQLDVLAAAPAYRILELDSNGRWATQVLHGEHT
jgi:3',5'-cyclic AMP phosphodiesterase CpdA